MIGRDFNQNIESNDTRIFFAQLGMKDIHKICNTIKSTQLDHTYHNGIKYIDSVATMPNIIRYIEGSKLMEIDAIIDTAYHSFVIDMNL